MNDKFFEPYHIIWHITNACNATCKYCFTTSYFSKKELKSRFWKLIVRRINEEKSVQRVSIIGGEPLLVKELPQIIKQLRKDLKINIDSNLLRIKEKWNDSFKKVCFSTTLDSLNDKINKKTRGYSAKTTLNNIKFLLAKGVEVQVIIVATKYNVSTLEKTVKYLLNNGVKRVGIGKVRMIGRAFNLGYSYFYDNSTTQKIINVIKSLVKEYGEEKIIAYNWYDKELFDLGIEYEPSCGCALFKACIDWNGFMYPCELMPFYWKIFENYYNIPLPHLKNRKIREIFANSKLFKFFREKMLYYPVGCESCEHKNVCDHGCRFHAFLISTNLLSRDPTCSKDVKSVYDVIGYSYYSPFSLIGKKRLSGKIGKFFKSLCDKLGYKIYDLGCGGGIWTFFFEDMKKKVIGIDNDRTMILIANEYKKLHNKNSKFVFSDIRRYNYKKADSAVLLDNTITYFSKDDFLKLLLKLKKSVNLFIVEIGKREIKEGKFNYKFDSFEICEKIRKINHETYEREFLNKQTGLSIKIYTYYWNIQKLRDVLKKFGKILFEKEIENSHFIIFKFSKN